MSSRVGLPALPPEWEIVPSADGGTELRIKGRPVPHGAHEAGRHSSTFRLYRRRNGMARADEHRRAPVLSGARGPLATRSPSPNFNAASALRPLPQGPLDLRDQLQATLGGTYTLDRELGGGGMSRVFSATETALGRKVVIKVLPPELAQGVSVERFKREITLAAQLQHPHIVPVLAAGETDGLPVLRHALRRRALAALAPHEGRSTADLRNHLAAARRGQGTRVRARARRRAPRHQAGQRAAHRRLAPSSATSESRRRSPQRRVAARTKRSPR